MSRTLPVSGPPDRPDVAIHIGGELLSRSIRSDLLRVDVHEEVGRLGRAQLLLRNWDEEADRIKHSDEGPFRSGAEVEVQMGYGAELQSVFSGVITGVRGNFLTGRVPTLEVACRCRGSVLAGPRRSRAFEETSDLGACRSIAQGAGLEVQQGEDGPDHPVLVQWRESAWDYLVRRAHVLGWVLYVRDRTLVFRPPEFGDPPVATLRWGGNVQELQVGEESFERLEASYRSSWNPASQSPEEGSLEAGREGSPSGNGESLRQTLDEAGWPDRHERLGQPGPIPPAELEARARGRMTRESLAFRSGRGRSLGVPALRIDTLVAIEGVGTRFNGPQYLTAVRHLLDHDRYVTEFQLGHPPIPSARPERPGGRATGVHPAVVTDLDDPEGWGGVRVRFPWLDVDFPPLRARLGRPDAGGDRGHFFLPEPDDEVLVSFLGGDPRYPVVVGALWNGSSSPPETATEENHRRTIVSREGHRVTFEDGDEAGIVLETSDGRRVRLSDGSGEIELGDPEGNRILLGADGVTIEAGSGKDVAISAPSGTVELEGAKLDASSTGPCSIQSSATLDLEASAVLGIQGSLVKINS